MPLLPAPQPAPAEDLLQQYADWAAERGTPLYPAQEEALLELAAGSHVVLGTPTGSGKSMVAVGGAWFALAQGRRTYYTAPIKALVSEKFFDLCDLFGAQQVGLITGDAAVNPQAPIICATAEILANLALRQGPQADIGLVCMDEFHYYGDRERGWAWQVPLIELTGAQFLLMSATLGDTSRIREALRRRTGREVAEVGGGERPVPLSFEFALTPLQETLELLLRDGRAPVYLLHATQAGAVESALSMLRANLGRPTKITGFRFGGGFGRTLSTLLRQGIGVHHAGLLPRYRRLVERLAREGELRIICGTDTLGVGINVPIRTVLIDSLVKFDGRRMRLLRAREFHQIAGRAGRPGFDAEGLVVVQAPDYEIENAKLVAKAGDDPKKLRRIVRKKPPEGTPGYNRATFDRLVAAPPEPLQSHLRITHSMLLNLAHRPDPRAALEHLLADNDESEEARARLAERAAAVEASLLAAGVVDEQLRLTDQAGTDLALDQPLSTFALAALELLDPASPTYELDVLSILEATLEDPRPVLLAQQKRARGELLEQLRAQGMEYEERMALLEEVTWPRPLAELLESALTIYATGHPWVSEYELRPKSVAREVYELAMTFGEYVAYHKLSTSEGVLLRYLSDAYKALDRTVPPSARTEALEELVEWLGALVRQVDSSLLDEWQRMVDPQHRPVEAEPLPLSGNRRAFRVMVRNAMFRRVELAALGRWDELGEGWEQAMARYYAEYDDLGTGPAARGPSLFAVADLGDRWLVRQTFDDPAGDRDWGFTAEVDLPASDAAGEVVLRVTSIGRFGE